MHKFFAKPLFLGKKVVFLTQCHSTNEELSSMSKNESIPEGTIVLTDHQLNGKGQRGNTWVDEPGKSLLFSILLKPKLLPIAKQYMLNLISGLSVIDTITNHLQVDPKLKWPNDIYINGKKVGGILTENTVKGSKIESSIVGIGINLNQDKVLIEQGSSLLIEGRKVTDRQSFMEDLLSSLESWYLRLKASKYQEIEEAYSSCMLWKDESHFFQDEHSKFNGIIRGIDEGGRLLLEKAEGNQSYDIKEIQFIS